MIYSLITESSIEENNVVKIYNHVTQLVDVFIYLLCYFFRNNIWFFADDSS